MGRSDLRTPGQAKSIIASPTAFRAVISFRWDSPLRGCVPPYGLQLLKGDALDARLAGVTFSEIADNLRRQGIGGVSVSRIAEGSRAYAAGLRSGDLVVALNRRDLQGASDFSRLAGSHPRQLMLTLLRGEEAYYLLLQ